MATFLPQQAASRPLPDFLPSSSPPDPAIFNNLSQQTHSTQNGNGNGNGNGNRIQHRLSADFRANGAAAYTNGNGAMPVPNGLPHQIPNGGSRHRGTMSLGAFDGPRSPPNTKSDAPHQYHIWAPARLTNSYHADTSHVPCKFFRSGQCQAGKACPFSHSTDVSTVDTPCKYFAKVRGAKLKVLTAMHALTYQPGQLQVRSKMRTGTHPSKWKKGQSTEWTCWRAAQPRRQVGSSIIPAIRPCFGTLTSSSASERSSTTFWSPDPSVCGERIRYATEAER